MNKSIKSILLFCLLITISCIPILNVSASSTVYTYEGYSYTLEDNNNAYICGWDNSTDTLVIPSKLDGNDVFGISNFAFQNNTYLTAVNFTGADYLKSIGMMAFCGCTGLSGNITVLGGVSAVSLGAFQECTSIEFFDYRANTIAIPAQCCYNCSSLKRVNIADGVQRIDSFAFANCYLLEYIKIPISVTSINANAFTNCRNLVIYCYTGSYAQQYAEDKGIEYVLIDAPPKEYFVGKSLSLDGDIGVNFYLDLTPDEAQSAMVNFSWNVNDQIKTASVKPKVSGGYKATCRIAPAEMTGSILAELLINGEKVDETRYSAKQYADVILSDSFQASYKGTGARSYENLRNLVLNMLSFGSRAQTAFDVNLDTLADKDSGYTPEVVRAEDIAVAEADMTEGLDNYGLFYAGSTLVCLTETTIRHYYRVTDSDKFNAVKNSIYIEGKPASPVEKNGSIYFEINNIPAADLDKDYTLKIGSNEYKYSALNYIKTALPSDKVEDDVKNLIQVLYLYNLAANAYFAK